MIEAHDSQVPDNPAGHGGEPLTSSGRQPPGRDEDDKQLAGGDQTPALRRGGRASDADRDAAAEQLRSALTDGRLGLDELDERLAATYAAKTHAELERVTADLSVPQPNKAGPLHLQTKSGSRTKDGYWVVPSHIVVECSSGTIKLDFTAAVCTHREVTIAANVASGSLVLIVPPGWNVDLDNVVTSSGSVVNKVVQRPDPSSTVLRVEGSAKSGSIKARYPRRTFWQWLTRQSRDPRLR